MPHRRALLFASFAATALVACGNGAPATILRESAAPSASAPLVTSASPTPSASVAPHVPVAPHAVWAVLDGSLDLLPANPEWATGQPQIHVTENGVSDVFQTVDLAKVPSSVAKLIGEKVRLFAAPSEPGRAPDGACVAKVTGLELYSPSYWQRDTRALVPHFDATPEASRPTDPKLVAEAKRLLEEVGGYRSLVARIELEDATACTFAATWAAPAAAPAPELAAFTEASSELATDAKARLRVLPVFNRIQAYYLKKKVSSEPAHWWELKEYDEGVEIARLADGRAIVKVGAGACRGYQDFTMNLEVFYALSPSGALTALEPARPSTARWALAVGDIDHNGEPDVVTMDGFMLSMGGRFQDQVFTRGPIYTCPGDGAASGAFNEQDH